MFKKLVGVVLVFFVLAAMALTLAGLWGFIPGTDVSYGVISLIVLSIGISAAAKVVDKFLTAEKPGKQPAK